MSWRERLPKMFTWLGIFGLVVGFLSGIGALSYFAELFPVWTGLNRLPEFDAQGNVTRYTPAKTLWDWLELLLIPAVLTGGGIWFTRSENRQAREIEKERVEENRRIEEKRLKEARAIEHERARDAIVESYLDQMTELLLNHKLCDSAEEDEVRSVARARTLTALRGVDGVRKGTIVQFLYESRLIGYPSGTEHVGNIIGLDGADLFESHLKDTYLFGVNLSGANLFRANLEHTYLRKAQLDWANLSGANLSGANLIGAMFGDTDLYGANLSGANLSGAHLSGANLIGANLSRANLSEAYLEAPKITRDNIRDTKFIRAKLREAKLSGAKLSKANLFGADLRRANLNEVDLSGANLSGTDLRSANLAQAKLSVTNLYGADLSGANLSGTNLRSANLGAVYLSDCVGLTLEQLLKTKSLHGARLPKYIDPADLGDKWSPPKTEDTPEFEH